MIRTFSGAQKTKATGVSAPAALKNSSLDYAPLASLVQWNINGQRQAGALLDSLQSFYADSDALYLAVKNIVSDGETTEALTALRGFLSVIQKAAERGAP